MIASISHDIKTPLTVIMGSSERLLRSALDKSKQDNYLRTIYTQSKNINQIVLSFDELLEQSIDSELIFKLISVDYICQMIKDEYEIYLEDKGVRFTIINQIQKEIVLSIDIIKIRRIFMNLINNSLKHNILVNLEICLYVYNDEEKVYFEIIDNGKGVSVENIEYLFEPFYTSDQSRKLSGLGLSICKLFVEQHQGKIWANNEKNGFKVTVEIPY